MCSINSSNTILHKKKIHKKTIISNVATKKYSCEIDIIIKSLTNINVTLKCDIYLRFIVISLDVVEKLGLLVCLLPLLASTRT